MGSRRSRSSARSTRGPPRSADRGSSHAGVHATNYRRVESKTRGGVVSKGGLEGRAMAPDTVDTIDLTELAELIEDEDPESDEAEAAPPATTTGEIAVA